MSFPFALEGGNGGGVGAVFEKTVKKRTASASAAAAPAFTFKLPGGITAVCEEGGGAKKQAQAQAPPPAPLPLPKRDPPITREEWLAQLEVTEEQARTIVNYEQGTPEWLASRVGRITSSNFGAAIGDNKYTSPRALLKQMLWGEFKGNAATRWGSEHENVARDEYIQIVKDQIAAAQQVCSYGQDDEVLADIGVKECGLVINPARPWMGNSPDGLITLTYASGRTEKGLLEIKCPFRKQFYEPDPVPLYYFAQVQGTMGNMGLPWCDFVVWTPSGVQVTRVPFDQAYWDNKLLPRVTSFYFDQYVPLAVAKENGDLAPGMLSNSKSILLL